MEKSADKLNWIQILAKDEQFKAGSVLLPESIWPTPIAKCYSDLYDLMEEGNVYGSLLQIKDLYETILKMPVLAALVYICGTNKEALLSDSDLLEKWIPKALSLGSWDSLGEAIINKNKKKQYSIPDVLADGIRMTRKLVAKKISSQYPNVLNWRNDVIGHGALQFEDSEEYQTAICGMLRNLKDYFEGQGKDFRGCENLYEKIVFYSNDVAMCGKNVTVTPQNENLYLLLDGQTVDVGAFAKMNTFLFSSFYYNKRTIKYLDYESGRDLVKDDFELYEYVHAYQKAEKYQNKKFSADVLRREEEKMFSLLSQPGKYIPPKSLFQRIEQFMEENRCGIIMMCMERGTGKSAFANSVDNLYHDPDTALIEDTVIRSYSLGSAELRGVKDFINAINVIFTRSYNADDDFRFSKGKKPEIKINDDNPDEALASVLNAYQEIYADEFGIYNLMLVLDGIDEATIDTCKILDYMPTSDHLNEGVYIVCTSRFEDEETVPYTAKKQIRKLVDKSDYCIEIRREESENQQILTHYICQEIPGADNELIKTLIEKSDYRMLYLKVYMTIFKSNMQYVVDENIASGYISQLIRRHNGRSSEMLRKTAAMICLLGPITINDYFEYISKEEPTYGFIGSINDLLPILTVRGSDYGREYMLANETYYAVFANEFHDEIVSLIDSIKTDFSRRFFPDEDDPYDNTTAARDKYSYDNTLSWDERFRIREENRFREETFWISTIKKAISFAGRYGLEVELLTEDLVNHYLMFADTFIVKSNRRNSHANNIREDALQTALNMLLLLARKSNLPFGFSPSLTYGSFARRLSYAEGYTDLLDAIFAENVSVDRIDSWKSVLFVQDFPDLERPVNYCYADKQLIDYIRKENLLDLVIDIFSSDIGNCYLPYLLYIETLNLDDALMEKTMNLIAWTYIYDTFNNNYKEAELWLNRLIDKGYTVHYPDNESVKKRLAFCLNRKKPTISKEMENLFSGFHYINADLTGVDYQEIDKVLKSTNPEIRTAAIKELKGCFDLVNSVFEDGILPENVWTDEDMSEEWASQDQYTILKNCKSLFKYVALVYENKTSDVLERWINCLNNCLEKHSDWDSYIKLHDIVDSLYCTFDKINEDDIGKRIIYLSRYVNRYNTRSYLISLWGYYEGAVSDILLPSEHAITLLLLYHDAELQDDARSLCENLSAGVKTFIDKILATISDSKRPISILFYFALYQYIYICRELGYYSTIKEIRIDFKQELSVLQRMVAASNKYSDLWHLNRIIDSILSFYKEVGVDDAVNDNVLSEIIMMLNEKIRSADEETAKELASIVEKIDEVREEIYG